MLPWTAAGIVNALSGPTLTTNEYPHSLTIVSRLPHSLLWMWLNILAFAIANQRSRSSISEDFINKPWRPIPSGRITGFQARNLLLGVVPLILFITACLGAGSTSALALVLNWMYNDLGGSDIHYTVRNLLNALAMIVASTGTTQVAMYNHSNNDYKFTATGYQWLIVQAAIVFTTLQIQDLRDQDGDRNRGRNTAPVVIGDNLTRWTIIGPVIFWSIFCPQFWAVNLLGHSFVLVLGGTLSTRVFLFRSTNADQVSWKIWGVWTFIIFMLPLYKQIGIVGI